MTSLRDKCSLYPFYDGHASSFLALVAAGASAVVIATEFNTPGILSGLESPKLHTSHRQLRQMEAPFVAIGARTGDTLVKKLRSVTTESGDESGDESRDESGDESGVTPLVL